MIAQLKGKLVESAAVSIVVDVQGVGYELHVPLSTSERLPAAGNEVLLYTLAVYREDSQTLYGFATRDDRDFFRLLVEKVSGIGPRTALSLLSKQNVGTLRQAIAAGDTTLLSKSPGIGKKTAERLVIELRDKVGIAPGTQGVPSSPTAESPALSTSATDAAAALITLGYKPADADKAVRKALSKMGETASTDALIKAALS